VNISLKTCSTGGAFMARLWDSMIYSKERKVFAIYRNK